MYKNFQKYQKTRKIPIKTSKNRQNTDQNIEKLSNLNFKVEKSLKTAKNVEKKIVEKI